jgi:hypothetical protein
MSRQLIIMYTMLGHGGSCATLPPPPPPPPPLEDDDSFNEFLDELNDNQACEVPANELQPAIVASFRMQRLEGNNTKTVKEVNQVLLERAMGVGLQTSRVRATYTRLSSAHIKIRASYD